MNFTIVEEYDPESGVIVIEVEGYRLAVRSPHATTRAELLDACEHQAQEYLSSKAAEAARTAAFMGQ